MQLHFHLKFRALPFDSIKLVQCSYLDCYSGAFNKGIVRKGTNWLGFIRVYVYDLICGLSFGIRAPALLLNSHVQNCIRNYGVGYFAYLIVNIKIKKIKLASRYIPHTAG